MPSTLIRFTQAAAENDEWLTPSLALAADGEEARWEWQFGGLPNTGGWLRLSHGDTDIPANAVVTGLELTAVHRASSNASEVRPPHRLDGAWPTDGTYERMEVALTLDGVTPAPGHRWIIYSDYSGETVVIGSSSYLWGRGEWTAAEVNANGFGVLIRHRKLDAFDVGWYRAVDYCDVRLHWSPGGGGGGGLITLPRETVLHNVLIGKEVTPGTAVACPIRLRAMNVQPQPSPRFREIRNPGEKTPVDNVLLREHANGPVEGYPTYDEIGWALSMLLGDPVTSTLSAGVYQHRWRMNARRNDAIKTFTCEYGDPASRSHRVTHMLLQQLGVEFGAEDLSLSGTIMARQIIDGITQTAGVNEVQRLVLSGSPTGGTLKLGFGGAITSGITGSGTMASAIQTALNALSTIGANGVTVSGSGTQYDITFNGAALSGREHPMIEVAENLLTGIGAPYTITPSKTTVGGYTEASIVPIRPGHVSLYLADTFAALAAGKLTDAYMSRFAFENRAVPRFVLDQAIGNTFKHHTEVPVNVRTVVTLQADSNGMALLANARTGARRFMRIEAIGPDVTVGNPHRLTIDQAVQVGGMGGFRDDEGIYATEFTLETRHDAAQGLSLAVTLVNGVASY